MHEDRALAKFRKRPLVIEAVQFQGCEGPDLFAWGDSPDLSKWLIEALNGHMIEILTDDSALIIHTLEGPMRAGPGDWVIRGIEGELYACRGDIFERTYEIEGQSA